ncbi:MAG: serine hydrolase, partial [Dokdonella sp.]
VSSDTLVPMVASEIAPGGTINSEPLNTPFTVRDLAKLMIGISDNTATDLMHQLLGRTFLNQVIVDFGVAQPDLLTPLLGISEQFHLFTSFNMTTALTYVNGTQAFKNQFLQNNIVPLGPNTGGAFANVPLYTDGSWRASPTDICRAFGQMLRLPQGSEAIMTVDAAAGAGVAQPDVRAKWDRVWYKGGSLASGANGFHVLTHAWMLQNAGQDPYVVIAMSNSVNGNIDQFFVQSVTGRILQLVALL